MGKGVAAALAKEAEVIIVARSEERAKATVDELGPNASYVLADLARLADVRRVTEELHAQHDALDGIFVNAGLGYAAGRVETEDGMDSHFQVNYLSHFMLTLNLLDLLERSEHGGRVIFNVASFGEMDWDDLQMERAWGYERGIGQAMVAKRMLVARLHALCRARDDSRVSFVGFQIPKTVWSNQINIIPWPMRFMATVVKLFGGFISIDDCGRIMAPLFTEPHASSLRRSGKLITEKKGALVEIPDTDFVLDPAEQDRLWRVSLALSDDDATRRIADQLVDKLAS